MSIVNSCASTYRSDAITSDGMLSMERNCESTKGSVRGDSLESAKTSISRASDSSGLSDDSNWSNITGSANKPHKGNDPRWKAILAIRARDGILGMSHFKLLKRLGCGDIGSVYLSELSSTRCYFAMKVMDKASLARGDLHTLRQRQPGKHFSEYAARYASRDLIRGLLVKEPQHRLGVKRGATEIKQHPFFEGVNWALIRCSTPPEVPRPVETELPGKFGPADPVGVSSSSKRMVGTDMMKSGGKYLDFEFF
ncbi:hypothetical protein Patl1_00105 [Pistacia atlantica]|uniref:Uncharacterized protein n=1 Tax=Pistacia atlantica TaxID=434234 RepID=A0ACC1CAC0_9ROSI|nr:hypothetical protein Patl1_00105 [Pistacia atlantica]